MKIKDALIIFIFVMSNLITHFIATTGIHKYADCIKTYSITDALDGEREIARSAINLLHRFYSNDDNDLWFEVIMLTPEYKDLDKALDGDWEDFYYYSTDIMDYEDNI